jgi:hypothetical protein
VVKGSVCSIAGTGFPVPSEFYRGCWALVMGAKCRAASACTAAAGLAGLFPASPTMVDRIVTAFGIKRSLVGLSVGQAGAKSGKARAALREVWRLMDGNPPTLAAFYFSLP